MLSSNSLCEKVSKGSEDEDGGQAGSTESCVGESEDLG